MYPRYIRIYHVAGVDSPISPRQGQDSVANHQDLHEKIPLMLARRGTLDLQSQQARPVRQEVIVAVRVGIPSLVEQLEIARIDRHCLVRAGADQVAVANVVCPGGAAVGLAGKGRVLGGGLGSPLAVEAGGCEGAEVAAVGADGLDDHEVCVLALDGVDLDGLEEVVCRVGHDGFVVCAKVAGEIGNGHAGAVDSAIVAAEEEVHIGVVADDGLVDGPRARVGDGPGEEGLRRRPGVGIGGIARLDVGEGRGAPLVGEDPDVLGLKVEERWRDGRGLLHGVLAGGGHVGPVGEEAKGKGPPAVARVVVCGVDEVLAVEGRVGEVLERGPARLGLGEGLGGRPGVGRRQAA